MASTSPYRDEKRWPGIVWWLDGNDLVIERNGRQRRRSFMGWQMDLHALVDRMTGKEKAPGE